MTPPSTNCASCAHARSASFELFPALAKRKPKCMDRGYWTLLRNSVEAPAPRRLDREPSSRVTDWRVQRADETEVPAAAKTVSISAWAKRSEEHTSELQSPVHLVCRLLLEKKNIYGI